MDEALTAFEEVFGEKAIAKGQRDIIRRLCRSGLLTTEQIAQAVGFSVAEVKKIASKRNTPRRNADQQAEESKKTVS